MPTACVIFDIGGVLELTPRTGWDRAREREETAYGFAALVGAPRAVVYSHEIGVGKPEARAFTLACER